MGLINASELAAVRETAESGMITDVTIKRSSIVETPEGSEDRWTTVVTVKGWLTEQTRPGAALGEVGGVQAVAGVYRLFVPVGTDIQANDQVLVNGGIFIVQYTDAEGTYLPMLTAILRRAE